MDGDSGPVGASNSGWTHLRPWKKESPKTGDLGQEVKLVKSKRDFASLKARRSRRLEDTAAAEQRLAAGGGITSPEAESLPLLAFSSLNMWFLRNSES